MLRLALPREPYWIDLPHGVRVQVRPLSTALWQAAQASARREIEALAKARADIEAAGGAVTDLPSLDDPDVRTGLSVALLSRALARLLIVAWENVADEHGAPAPLTPANAVRLVEHNEIAEALLVAVHTPLDAVAREGNGSGLAQPGTTAEAPPTAEAAASPAGTAPIH